MAFSLFRNNERVAAEEFFADLIVKKSAMTELAVNIAVNRIADVIAKCGFSVLSQIEKDTAKEIEYQLNVKPNVNQNSTDFWRQAIKLMITQENGCLLINTNKDGIFIADSWTESKDVIKEKKISDVRIVVNKDSYYLNKRFKFSDVVHLKYSNDAIMCELKKANGDIAELMGAVRNGIKSKSPIVHVVAEGKSKLMDANGNVYTTNEYAKKIAKELSDSELKSLVSGSGIKINLEEGKSALSTSDLKELREMVFGNTAAAFGIPKNILLGDVINQSNNEFITYACEPVMAAIDDALCGAWLSKEEWLRGDKIIVNKLCIRHVDVIDSANNLDKLYSNGWSHNDIMKLLGQPEIDEDWANARRFTKNYAEGGKEGEE